MLKDRIDGCLKFKINKKFVKKCDGEMFILSEDEKSMSIVNEIGAKIIELADNKRTLDEISKSLTEEYSVNREKLESDSELFLEKMKLLGYL
jgi:hypothetical protein